MLDGVALLWPAVYFLSQSLKLPLFEVPPDSWSPIVCVARRPHSYLLGLIIDLAAKLCAALLLDAALSSPQLPVTDTARLRRHTV
ncbi:hypothetical protein BDU57DRAFT_508311 [Ampelomyces quisqualis]|uniref:Uncharacterized protein n=1 Tax=Ampelomyces quisqualis TaxID=50730 RepID=A0A6A5R226_AMPQU|nr:hypothetical protein BDU57DRAFT_508311 [Ampelomyces quisqualis]